MKIKRLLEIIVFNSLCLLFDSYSSAKTLRPLRLCGELGFTFTAESQCCQSFRREIGI